MLFNSGTFWLLFLLFLAFYRYLYHRIQARLVYVVVFSLFFYYKSSGWYVLVFGGLIVLNYYLGLWLSRLRVPDNRRLLLTLGIVSNLSFLLYFKYTNFLVQQIFYLMGGDFERLDIFLPIGISFYTFQVISYLVDVYRGEIAPERSLLGFAFYLSFFPQLVAGPIVRARDFLPQIRRPITFDLITLHTGTYLVLKGLFKKAVIADYLAQYVDIVYSNPVGYSGFENLMAMYAYTLQIYCDFSGYSDMAIGLGLWMGFHLPENFRSPYQSGSITEFWRRWHISLSFWLRDYLYIAMGGNRKGVAKQYVFLMLTMLIGGLWHGASWSFVVWGGAHGLGLMVHKWFVAQTPARWRESEVGLVLGWLLTFHFVAVLWVFFRNADFALALGSLWQIVAHFDLAFVAPFWAARPWVCVMLLLGFTLHFIPHWFKQEALAWFVGWPLIVKIIFWVLVVQLIIQFQSETVQPFIYFQF